MDSLSYWAATTPAQKRHRDTPLPGTVDCAVIGGGLTGLSAAYHLAREGLRVALLEREHLGWGASSRNGGMGIPHMHKSVDALIQQHGLDATRRMFLASVGANDLAKALIAREGIDCHLEETGSFAAAYRPSHYGALEKWHRRLAEQFDHPTRLVPPERLHEELGTGSYYGGLLDESGIGLHPARFVAGMGQAADRAGVSLHEGTPAQKVRRTGEGFEVETARGTLAAKEVIIATNGYTGDLTPPLRRRVVPLTSFSIVTEPLKASLADQLIPHRRMVYDTKNNLYYFRILPDNRMLFGGSPRYTPGSAARAGEHLRRGMVALFPALSEARIDYAWGGLCGITFDRMPHTGQMDGLHYALGYNGDGLTMSVYMGRSLAQTITGQTELHPFANLPFPSNIFYHKRPWFLPLVKAYFHAKDWIS